MSIYSAFAASLRERARFLDKFRMMAGAPAGALANLAPMLSEDRIDEWILDTENQEIARLLSDAADPLLATIVGQSQTWARELSLRLPERPAFFGEILSTHLLNCDPHSSGITIAIAFEGGTLFTNQDPSNWTMHITRSSPL